MPNPKAHGAEPLKTRPLTGSPPSTPTRGPTMQDNDRARRHRRPAAQAGQPLLADPERQAAGSRHRPRRTRPRHRRPRLRQDARHHHADRLPHRAGPRRAGRDRRHHVHAEGGRRDEQPARGTPPGPRHAPGVDLHLPPAVRKHPARTRGPQRHPARLRDRRRGRATRHHAPVHVRRQRRHPHLEAADPRPADERAQET